MYKHKNKKSNRKLNKINLEEGNIWTLWISKFKKRMQKENMVELWLSMKEELIMEIFKPMKKWTLRISIQKFPELGPINKAYKKDILKKCLQVKML